MNRDTFNKHVDTVIANCKAILGTKGEDYSYAEEDRLSNFKETAKEVSLTKYNVWYVYFNKGLSSIRRYITEGKVESENIHSRILDAINYLMLLDAMIAEDEPTKEVGLGFDGGRTTSLPSPEKATVKVPKYIPGQKVTKHGVACIVQSVSNLSQGVSYDLQSTKSGYEFKEVPEEEIKV